MALRLDANGAWSVEEAVRCIEALQPAGLELVEEPVHGVPELRAVRERVTTRIAMDETAAEHGAVGSGATDAVCLKLARCGGISSMLAAATLVRTTRAEVYIASTLDGPLGIAAALHCAAALRVAAPCGLATLGLLEVDDPFPPREGRMTVPTGPGLVPVNARQLTMLLVLAAMWGASFLFIAIAVEDLGAVGVAEGRTVFGVAGLLIYAAALSRLPSLRSRWRAFLALGAVNAAVPFVLIAAAQLTIPASIAAIVNATAPLFSAVGAAIWLGEALNRRSALGLALGLAGVALVVGLAPIDLDGATLLAVGASMGAAALYAAGGHLTKLRFSGVPPVALAIGQLTAATILLVPALAVDPPRHAPGAGPIAAVVALGLLSTGVAYLIYFRLIEELGATSALTVTYLVPVFGVLWAALFRDEQITVGMLVGAAVVLAGVLLVTGTAPRRRDRRRHSLRSLPKQRRAPPPARPPEARLRATR